MSLELKISDQKVIGAFREKVRSLEDSADQRGKHYSLEAILSCIAIGLLQNENDFCNIEHTLKIDEAVITQFLEIKTIPSDDTLRRRLETVDPITLSLLLDDKDDPKEDYLILDGKGLRASASTEEEEGVTPYVLNAKSRKTGKCIGAVYVGPKESEKTKAEDLIRLLERTGRTFGADAALNTKKIRDQLHKSGNHYVFPIKDNNKTMRRAAESLFEEAEQIKALEEDRAYYLPHNVKIYKPFDDGAYSQMIEMKREHAREELREYSLLVLTPEQQADFLDENVKAIGKVVRRVKKQKIKRGRKKKRQKLARRQNRRKKSHKKIISVPSNKVRLVETEQIVYYNMDFVPENVERLAYYSREEWDIENRLHYILDETFREDRSTLRKENLRLNMAILRRIIYNLLLSVGLSDEKAPKNKQTPHTKRAFFAKDLAGTLGLLFGPFNEEQMVWLKTLMAEAFVEKTERTLGAFAQ